MTYREFLSKLIDNCRDIATAFYYSESKGCLEGALSGIEACRHKSPEDLALLLFRAERVHRGALHKTVKSRYWWTNCFLHEVEWICNVVSFVLVNQGMDAIIQPTVDAAYKAKELVDSAVEPN